MSCTEQPGGVSVRARFRCALALFLASVAPPLSATVTINYGALVDESPVTHAGETVGDVVLRLKLASNPKLKAITSSEIAGMRQALEEAKENGELTDEEYAEKAEMLEKITLIKKASSPDQIRALKGLVEPFLERYAYVMESYIRNRESDPRPPLIDVGDLFPPGTAQPAWAYLIRTRRYYVLTDGRGFVRMFVPGETSESAYRKHYSLLRHVLAYLYRSAEGKALNVEVYAYRNDFAAMSFALNDVPYKTTISNEPPPSAGRIALPLAGLDQFLRDGFTIEGASLSSAGKLSLLGTKQSTTPTLEGQPLTLADLAVAYRATAYAGFNDVYISIDPSSNPGIANINFGGGLEDTRIGWVTLRADMRFKTIGDGFDPVTGTDLSSEVAKSVPGFRTQQARWFQAKPDVASESTRFWFYPDDIKLTESAGGTLLRIVSPRYTPAAERQAAWSQSGELTNKTPSWTADAIKHLNQNYDKYAAVFPELGELDTAGRLLALAAWLHKKNAGREPRLDLDELLDVELPACYTPRQRAQMHLAYFVSENSDKIFAFNLSHVAESAWTGVDEEHVLAGVVAQMLIETAGLSLLKKADPDVVISDDLEPAGYHGYSVVAGGLDLDITKRLPRRGSMVTSEAELLQRVASSGNGEDIPGGGAVWRRSGSANGESRPLPVWVRRESNAEIAARTHTTIANDERTFASEVAPGETEGWQSRGAISMTGDVETRIVTKNGATVFARRTGGTEALRYSLKGSGGRFVAERLPTLVAAPKEQLSVAEAAVRARGVATEDLWKVLPADTPVVAVDAAPDGTIAILSGPSEAYRLDYVLNGEITRSVTDNALSDFQSISSARIQNAGDGKRRFLYVTTDEATNNIVIELGSHRVNTTRKEFVQTLNDALRSAAADGATDVIVYRDALDRRPASYGGSLRRASVSDPVRLVAHINDQADQPLRAHLANDIDLAIANHNRLGTIRSRDNVAVVLIGADANVETHGLNTRVRGVLKDSGLPIVDDLSSVGSKSDVILVWGHNDKALELYLTKAGDGGYLKNKVLLLATCFADGNANLFQTLVTRYGAVAVMIHSERIVPVALQRVLLEIPGIIKAAEATQTTVDPSRLFSMAAEKVLQDPNLSEQLRTSIEKLLRSGLQISDNLEREQETPSV